MSTDDYSKNFYSKNAEQYTAHVRNPLDSVYHAYYEKPAMYALLPDLKGKRVLSIGCGSGEDSLYLKKQGASDSVGIDITPELIAIAKKSYPECEFRVMDMEQLDFPSESFDFAYSSLAVHYVEDWTKVFRNVFKILKPGSNFLFSCGNHVKFCMEGSEDEKHSIKKLEVVKEKSTGNLNITGDYMSKKKNIDALGDNTANTWSMSVSDISRSISDAGFLIEQIVEPKPLEGLKEIQPMTYYRLSKIPEFIIFKLIKV
jgi:ubiquinone/menaquinone biosynthesis C-methylase UbiE